MDIKSIVPNDNKSFTINYDEKSVIVFAKNEEEACLLLSEALISVETTDRVKQSILASIADQHSRFLRLATENATTEERDTWQAKALAAEAFLDGNASEPQKEMLSLEIGFTNEAIQELCSKIIDKQKRYLALVGAAAGLKRRSEYQIENTDDLKKIKEVLSSFQQDIKKLIEERSTNA
jgi:hypothetical protein